MQTVILRKCLLMLLGAALLPSCQGKEKGGVVEKEKPLTGEGDAAAVKKADDSLSAKKEAEKEAGSFEHRSEKFGDSQILRYEVPGFDGLTLEQKKLAYYLYEAALAGRDIAYDQKYKHNLTIRRTLEAMVRTYKGDRKDAEFQQLLTYLKQVWFARGIHHDYSSEKFLPSFSKEFFAKTVKSIDPGSLPLKEGEKVDALIERLTPILFDPKVDAKRVNRDTEADPIRDSANNFYEGLTEKEVDAYYAKRIDPKATRPLSHGLNSKLVKGADGKIEERVWKVDGMYGAAISKVVSWLSKALPHTENAEQKKALEELIRYYKTGDLAAFDAYNIAWVKDTNSRVDVVNGFIEVYGDAKGFRGTYESVVSIKDQEASKRIAAIAGQAQWFEDHSPLIDSHKKKDVVGISAKVITVVVESGDAAPTTPIGINLPNANWIRAEHGSKSVYLGNIVAAYNKSKEGNGLLEEFAFSKEEVERAKKYGTLAQTLFVDMHEVIGHASGQINPGVGTPKETLKSYASALEEGRADPCRALLHHGSQVGGDGLDAQPRSRQSGLRQLHSQRPDGSARSLGSRQADRRVPYA